jgi:Protein of unknown function (DUF3073)
LYLYGCWGTSRYCPLRVGGAVLWRTETSETKIMGPDRLRTFKGVEPMGRGRAKAKQVKVARQLKYNKSDDNDLDRLRAELGVGADSGNGSYDSEAGDDDEEDDDPPGSSDSASGWKDAEDAWPR